MKPKWYFYPAWIIMNTLITPISWGISWVLISQIVKMVGGTIQVAGQTRITEDFLGFYVLIPILGLLTGLLQYLLLRIYLPRPRWWIAATLLGWLLVLGVLRLTTTLPLPAYSLDTAGVVLGAALVGLAIGLPQWWMLRARVGHAAWWLLTLAIGWGLLGFLNGHTITNPWFFFILGSIPATATAAACWLLLDWFPNQGTSEIKE